MKDVKDIVQLVKAYKKVHTDSSAPFEDDYSWGVCNGVELALALLEDRPAFFIDKNKGYDSYDIKTNPEYFL